MCFETTRSPEEIEGSRRLPSEDIRELFERYGSREPEGPVLTKPAEAPDHERELSLSGR